MHDMESKRVQVPAYAGYIVPVSHRTNGPLYYGAKGMQGLLAEVDSIQPTFHRAGLQQGPASLRNAMRGCARGNEAEV